MSVPRLRITKVKKCFGATQALRDVSLVVGSGEVHALIGENGAGKSTLMKILSAAHSPDGGEIQLDGQVFAPATPLEARSAGVAMIYQELSLVPHLSVEENILLGREPQRLGWIDRSERRRLALAALAKLNQQHLPLKVPVNQLSLAQQQMVEIARALVGSPRVLIMDEPTSSLTQVDTKNLFEVILRLRDSGVSIIYISHFLEECLELASHYTVLRDGESVGTGLMTRDALPGIMRLLVGRELSEVYPRVPHSVGATLLEVTQLRGVLKPRNVSFQLRAGEILGIAGIIGAGRTETLRALFGLDPQIGGEVKLRGTCCNRTTPRAWLQKRVGYLSENRKEEGLMLGRSISDNLLLSNLHPCATGGFINRRRQDRLASSWMSTLGVKARNSAQNISDLSGGNQQKVALGRLLHHDAEILLLDEPTRGIDVGSKAQIYQIIGQLAAAGKSVIFISSYLPELLGVCDTIGVMCRGTIRTIRPAPEWTEHSIIATAIGQDEN